MSENPYLGPASEPVTQLSTPRRFTLIELLVVVSIIGTLCSLILPAIRTSRPAGLRMECLNNMRNVSIALQMYRQSHGGQFPPAYTTDEDGRPLHSWRTLILPYMDDQRLFDSIDLTRPWNDPVNAAALAQIPPYYRCPAAGLSGNLTTCAAITDLEGRFTADASTQITDESEQNIPRLLLVDLPIDRAVPWMSPQDAFVHDLFSISAQSKLAHPGVVVISHSDGSVSTVNAESFAQRPE